jgi:hypothetical protein
MAKWCRLRATSKFLSETDCRSYDHAVRRVATYLLGGVLLWLAHQTQYENAAAQDRAPAAAAPTKVAPSLAKAKLADAASAAKKWKADAVLIQVEGHVTGDAGTTIAWAYGFYSSAAKGCALIFARAGGAGVAETEGEECKSSELKEFMDSDQALKMARGNGVIDSKVSMVAHVAPTPQDERAVWTVMDESGMKPGNVILDIDAQTGAVVSKMTQR